MSETARDELWTLVRSLGAHCDWQRELGATGLEREPAGTLVAPATKPAPSPPVALAPPPRPPPAAAAASAPARPAPSAPLLPTLAGPLGPVVVGEARTRSLTVLREQVASCTVCKLARTRTQTVFARGLDTARICFVGEGPGRDEDEQGEPFVGAAGQLLDRIVAGMKLERNEVYVCNVVKCRPPSNRVPEPDEVAACAGFLVRQLELVRPEVIVALGRSAAQFLLASRENMSAMRGRWHQWRGVPVRVTWHPSYILHQQEPEANKKARRETWEDMKQVLSRLEPALPMRSE